MMIYRATFYAATGKAIDVAVDTTEQDARADLLTAAAAVSCIPYAMVRLHDVQPACRP